MSRKRRGRSEGSIYERSDGVWTASVSLGYSAAGKRRRRVVYGTSKAEVLAKLKSLDPNKPADADKHTIETWLTRWLEHTAKPKVGPTTYDRYEQLVRIHIIPRLGSIRLSQLAEQDVEDFYARLRKDEESTWTQKMCGSLLATALRPAVKRGLMVRNPAAEVVKPQPADEELDVLSDDEVKKFLTTVTGNRLEALFLLAVHSGMRQGELLGLQWGDVDFGAGLIHVRRSLAVVKGRGFVLKDPKSKKSRRSIAVGPVVMEALQEHRKKMMVEGNAAAPVFCTRTGTHIAKSNFVRYTYQPQIKKAGLRSVHFHSFRHYHATALLSRGFSVKAVSERLGHSRIEITLRVYGHKLPGDDAKLAGAMQDILNRPIGYSQATNRAAASS